MSRWVPVHRKDFICDELTGEQWVDLDELQQILTTIDGGARLVWEDQSFVNVKETPEQLIKLIGA